MYQPNGQQRPGVVEQRHACTSYAIAFNGNVDRKSHRLTIGHVQSKEKADKAALAEVLDKTFVEALNLNDRHDENSNPIDLEVVQEDQSVNEASADSSKSFNEAQRTAESISISADKTYGDQLIQSYLANQPHIEVALFCCVCREYFAFEENALRIHRQSARHLERRTRPYIRSTIENCRILRNQDKKIG